MTDEQRFIDFYNEYKHKIYSFVCYRVGGDINLAEDLTSDAFLKAFEKFESYNPKFAFSTWIFTIARNTIIDHYRQGQSASVDLEDVQEALVNEDDTEMKWIENLDRPPKLETIYAALEKLSDFQKDCVIMKYLEDEDTKEIAVVTDQTESYVRMALSRGLRKLKPLLQTIQTLLMLYLLPFL